QTVGEVLGLDLSRIRVVTGDSEVVPKDNGSYSSRVTFMVGNAAIDAAQNLKRVLVAAAARKLDAKPEEIECLGELYRAGAQDKGLTFNEVVTEALKDTGTITVTGNYSTLPQSHGGKKYRGAAIGGTTGYSYAAQVVEVSVDEDTGVVNVDKVWVAHDCGKALNRLTVEGQVQGSVWMGMGQAMSEETAYHDGLLITGNMLDYRVPTIQDSPPIEVGIVESNDPHGPFGAKEAGEGSLAAFLPALTNAIADAIGVRFTALPVTPDRVFAALEKRRRAGNVHGEKANSKTARSNGRLINLSAVVPADAKTHIPEAGVVWVPASAGTTAKLVPKRNSPDGRAAGVCARAREDARRRDPRARQPSRKFAARRRHRPRGQYPPRHRRAAGAHRRQPRGRAARDPRRRAFARDRRRGQARRARRASRRDAALSGGGAGRRLHRRADPSQHGHRRRQSVPRYALPVL